MTRARTRLAGMVVLALACAAAGAGCSVGVGLGVSIPVGRRPARVLLPPEPGETQTGHASWYGRRHHGRPTASGEVFNMHDMTAAHRSLPFGTRVRVRRLDTGHTVVVRINDRGPFVGGRIIDLSYGAARMLRMSRAGVVPVALKVLHHPEEALP